MAKLELNRIILSRTDNIGDVVLTLPLAGYLKKILPELIIYFIGKSYTAPVIEACEHIDYFLDKDLIIQDAIILRNIEADAIFHIFPDKEIAKAAFKAKIPVRVGTSHRWFHWLYCNKLSNFSRRNSNLHEALLNFKLLQRILPHTPVTLEAIAMLYGLHSHVSLPPKFQRFFTDSKINIILHPKSKGSAREWPLENYKSLAKQFSPDQFSFFITGTSTEGKAMKEALPSLFSIGHLYDLSGELTLAELITFIDKCNGLVACSTGPLHIAAALGKFALGIYPPMKPIDPGRWAAVGNKTKILVLDKACSDCKVSGACHCIAAISVAEVASEIVQQYGN